ncbi:hypothetical protein [Thermofilum pendens]|uniref:Uncharacterized protein n=1 Tax=Thermofilum pendens (strain DSM 2475 / Hrk 5) TaxID=368408 RepID=A1S1E2_THEPD|nr:hypothetical protein [Thermofilum pendens]ABL79272.1 hypothetical protein Tpen_1877 [Thermofilum pendens Hrk 5]
MSVTTTVEKTREQIKRVRELYRGAQLKKVDSPVRYVRVYLAAPEHIYDYVLTFGHDYAEDKTFAIVHLREIWEGEFFEDIIEEHDELKVWEGAEGDGVILWFLGYVGEVIELWSDLDIHVMVEFHEDFEDIVNYYLGAEEDWEEEEEDWEGFCEE